MCKVWTLKERQGVCQWCGHLAICQSSPTKPRSIKSRSNGYKRQAQVHSNGYDQLQGEWLAYYNVASHFTDRVKVEDKEDILHTIIATLADVERNNGHKPFTEAAMYRIASRTVATTGLATTPILAVWTVSTVARHNGTGVKRATSIPSVPKLSSWRA